MKNIIVIIVVLSLCTCSEINIAPNQIDNEAAAARKKDAFVVRVNPPYTLSLKNANIYLTYDGIINFPDNNPPTDINVKFIVITDGTRIIPTRSWGGTIDEYENATYIVVFYFFSAPNGQAESGKFLALTGDLGDVHPDGTKTIRYSEQTFNFGSIDRTHQLRVNDEQYPTTTQLFPSEEKQYIFVDGNLTGGEKVTLTLKTSFQYFGVFADVADPTYKIADGYFNVSGVIDDTNVKYGNTSARKSSVVLPVDGQ